MTTLFIVRHGRTAWNLEGRIMGQTDIPLDELGCAQVTALGRRLGASLAGQKPDAIYTSDLQRARETAQAIRSSLAVQPELRPDVRLRELCFGDWEGMTFDEIRASDPNAAAIWEKDWMHVAPPRGETLTEFSERVRSAYRDICKAHPEGIVVVAGHGGSMQLLIAMALELPPEKYWQFHLSNASLTKINNHPSGAILELLNDISHLETVR